MERFTKEEIMVLLAGLRMVLIKAEEGEYVYTEGLGICDHLYKETYKEFRCTAAYTFVRLASKGWEHNTGIESFPVPHKTGDGYFFWQGKELDLRIDLLKYLISKAETYLSEANA